MIITFSHKGDFAKTLLFLRRNAENDHMSNLDYYARMGVDALKSATPIDSGLTADSWYYEIDKTIKGIVIRWCNSNINEGVPIAVILQYGHGTGTGGYVEGTDYINPAIKPIFDEIADAVWKEVTNK